MIAASASLFQPNCVARFSVLVITSVINLYNKLPFVPNHILYEGMLHLVMLLALLGFFISKRGRDEWQQVGAGWKCHLPLLLLAIILKWSYFNFELINRFFENHGSSEKVYQKISDNTWNDLDLNEVFKFIDRTTSKIGQQYLYFKLSFNDS